MAYATDPNAQPYLVVGRRVVVFVVGAGEAEMPAAAQRASRTEHGLDAVADVLNPICSTASMHALTMPTGSGGVKDRGSKISKARGSEMS
jgi:hypothetical protein